MKMKKRAASLVLGLLMAFCLLLAPVSSIETEAATANDAVTAATDGVMQFAIEVSVDGTAYGYMTAGSCFLIGEEGSAQYILTNYHVVNALTESEALTMLGLDSSHTIDLSYSVILYRDVRISATYVQGSQEADWALLKLDQTITNKTPLVLADSDDYGTTENVWALGFPSIVAAIQAESDYSSEDVTITDGTISKTTAVVLVSDQIDCFTHTATLYNGNSGGPLVDENGYVIGINTLMDSVTNNYYFATKINEVKIVLDSLGITYMTPETTTVSAETEAETTAETETAAQTEAAAETEAETIAQTEAETEDPTAEIREDLEKLITTAQAVSTDGYTSESVETFESALSVATTLVSSSSATESDLQSAYDNLSAAYSGLEEKSGLNQQMILIVAVIVIVVVVVLIVIFLLMKSKKKTPPQQQPPTSVGPGTGPTGGPGYGPGQDDEGAGDTGVLNPGDAPTSVLNGAQLPPAYLVRRRGGQRIQISKQVFKIGKERRKVDYCISDNTNVSRTHADILFKDGSFFIVDNNTTNGTSVNGVSLAPGQERRLANGDIIKMADEEFMFNA